MTMERRKKETREEWQRLVEDCKRSQKSQVDYCRENNINISTFRNWSCKLGLSGSRLKVAIEGIRNTKEQFIGFKISQPGVKINLPNGINVEVIGQDVISLIKELINVA